MALVDIGQALRALLLSDSAVSTAVGGQRVFPTVLPQMEKRPSLVYFRVSEFSGLHMTGPDWLMSTRIQLNAWAGSADEAAALADAALLVLNGYRGSPGTPPVPIQQIEFLNLAQEDYDGGSALYRTGRDYMVRYEPA